MAERKVVSELLQQITHELKGTITSPRREAELLMMAHLECDQLYLIAHSDDEVKEEERLLQWCKRRKEQEPLEYITNRVSFYSQYFYIDSNALIPRPETELLIDEVLKQLNHDTDECIVEVGVGSGIISIVLAQHLPKARFIAVDISEEALSVAKRNIEHFGLEQRIELRQSDLLESVEEKIDILVSNPPYIANDALLDENLSYEPNRALFGGEIGDEIIQKLLDLTCKRNIRLFACEMGYDQKEKVTSYLSEYESLAFYKDYAGFDRGFILKGVEK
jgi:release factor glutamine methyltransferase